MDDLTTKAAISSVGMAVGKCGRAILELTETLNNAGIKRKRLAKVYRELEYVTEYLELASSMLQNGGEK